MGAAIGAGFAAFESAGYALQLGMAAGENTMVSIIFMRGWMANRHTFLGSDYSCSTCLCQERNIIKSRSFF
ncbi:hypothetical protein [Gracilibacillus alcaliphilus]|uniref:hypothetical protein n=1 Tax=Gracilibacillus alcaliphilus TaxID=1401441 RepID=UPI001958DD24